MPPPLDLLPALLNGLGQTLVITVGGCGVAVLAAFIAAFGRRSQDVIVWAFAAVYVEVFRGTSALVQLYWFYFALPLLFGIQLHAVVVGVLVLGLNIGAYGAEVVRGALEAVPRGQWQVSTALNLSEWQTMRYVILPQALRMMLPPFGNLMIELLKSTALVSMITVTDLTRAGMFLRDDTHRNAEVFGLLLVLYFMLSLLITAAVRGLERRLARGQDQGVR